MLEHLSVIRGVAVSAAAALLLAPRAAGDPPAPIDHDVPPTVSVADARIKEGQSGSAELVFTVRLSHPSVDRATVRFTTIDGTATADDADFDPADGVLEFSTDDTVSTIAVVVRGDGELEGNEWFVLRLSEPLGLALADSEAVGTITNDEGPFFIHNWLTNGDYQVGTLPTAWGDYNGDGYLDIPLFLGGPSRPFQEMPGFRDLLAEGNYHGASSCDYDRDGDLDLAILGYTLGERLTPSLLLQNQGDGTFVNVAPQLGMAVTGGGETAVWGDFDGDGWPDLFAPYYTDRTPFQSFLYRNNGDGTFTDRAAEAGVSTPGEPWRFHPEGAHTADWNDDGYLDIYCASHLFINDGHGNFFDMRAAVGLPDRFDEGCSFADYDNDGDLDFYTRSLVSPHLFRNDSGSFTEVTAEAGIGGIPLSWGDSWADVDNDGDVDLVQHGQITRLMLNQGDGTFERDLQFESVSSTRELSAWADADNDGDLDVAIGTMGKQLLVNKVNLKPRFNTSRLRVRVLDADGHQTMHGATVRLWQVDGPPGTTQTRIVDGGSGYLSQGEYIVHFGGVGTGRYTLEVAFPSPAGTRVVVDGSTDARLESLEPGPANISEITVYRDGRVDIAPAGVAGVAPIRPPNGAVRILGAPSPSPARRSVSIPVALRDPGRLTLTILDLRGRRVRALLGADFATGDRTIEWDLADDGGVSVPTGVYFCRAQLNGVDAGSRRLLVVR